MVNLATSITLVPTVGVLAGEGRNDTVVRQRSGHAAELDGEERAGGAQSQRT